MSIENSSIEQEKQKTLSIEKSAYNQVSVSLSEKFKEKPEDELMGNLLGIKSLLDNALADTGVLFEVIPNEQDCSVDIRPFNPDEDISFKVMDIIENEINVLNEVL